MLAAGRTRLGVNHHVSRHNFADALFDGIAQGMHLFQAGSARHADGSIHEMPVAGAAHADALDVQHAIHASYCASNLLLQAYRCRIQQGVQSAPSEARTKP